MTPFLTTGVMRAALRLAAGVLLLALGLSLSLGVVAAPSPSRLVLDDKVPTFDAWPAVTLRYDSDAKLSVDEAIAAMPDFNASTSAYATLGTRKKVVWLRVPVSVPLQSNGRWILEFDYALLNRIDVHVVSDGHLVSRRALGNAVPFAQRPLPGRSHAVILELERGKDVDLLLRVETIGAMILPLSLSKLPAFHQRALDELFLQGMLTCLGLCLLLYSLLHWFSVREHLYLKYSLLVLASTLFSVHFFGIGEVYLWTDMLWPERHMAGITSLLASGATALFIEDILGADSSPRLRRALKIVALALSIAALAHALDIIDIAVVSLLMSTLGLAPSLLGLPGAIARVRRHDSVGAWLIFAWVGYFITAAIMGGLVGGRIGANFWTMHAFQFGASLDMLIFLRVAVLRSAAVHAAAQRATRDHETLHSLAHSDPLTGLLNRRGLNTTLTAALHNCNREQLLAVYMLDLDGFKPVNDLFGHDVGDELLATVAQRLRAAVRNGDAVARVGGDEFVVMAGGLRNEQQAQELGAKLLGTLREPFALGQEQCRVGATIGYVLAPLDGHDAVNLLKVADAAMYAGKESGKGSLRRGAASASP